VRKDLAGFVKYIFWDYEKVFASIRWAGHVVRIGHRTGSYRVLVEKTTWNTQALMGA
jgi:hypothetical protein